MFSCLQILEAFLWFVLITLLNVTLIILTLSVSRLLNLLLRLVVFVLFLNHHVLRLRGEFLSVTDKLMDEFAECYNLFPRRESNNTIDRRPEGDEKWFLENE